MLSASDFVMEQMSYGDGSSNGTLVDMYSNQRDRGSGFSWFINETVMDINETVMDINVSSSSQEYLKILEHVNIVCYLLICTLGLMGNSLVIYVILMYAKMKTVSNIYILNLAFSDMMFLTMLPITATTVILKHWLFGVIICKVYFVLCAMNIFGGAFNLCVMSADRYMAVCHPILSLKYRTPRLALFVCLCVWTLTFLVMVPVIMNATTTKNQKMAGKYSCKLDWPAVQGIHTAEAFVWYSFILGFAIPVFLISVFYILVIIKLQQIGAAKKSTDTRRSRGRVTRLIFCIIVIYVVCLLPYWSLQVHRNIYSRETVSSGMIFLFNGFTILSYANSMLNPLLYAFLSENFRQSFMKAFKCISYKDNTRSAYTERSLFPCTSQTFMRTGSSSAIEDKIELPLMDTNSVASLETSAGKNCYKVHKDEQGFLKPPTQF